MKKIFLFLSFTMLATIAFAQFPQKQLLGGNNTQVHVPGAFFIDSSFVLGKNYPDSTTANLSALKKEGSVILINKRPYIRTNNQWQLFGVQAIYKIGKGLKFSNDSILLNNTYLPDPNQGTYNQFIYDPTRKNFVLFANASIDTAGNNNFFMHPVNHIASGVYKSDNININGVTVGGGNTAIRGYAESSSIYGSIGIGGTAKGGSLALNGGVADGFGAAAIGYTEAKGYGAISIGSNAGVGGANGDRALSLMGGRADSYGLAYENLGGSAASHAYNTGIAIGGGLVARTLETVFGRWNDTTNTYKSGNSYADQNRVFTVGNGFQDPEEDTIGRKNALEIYYSGRAKFNGVVQIGNDTAATKADVRAMAGGGSSPDAATKAGAETFANKTLTRPKIVSGGSIDDENGNEYIKFTRLTSAVNEIRIDNAVAGSRPVLGTSGNDANIDLNFAPKDTGVLRLNNIYLPQSTTVYNVREDNRPKYGQPNAAANGSTDDATAIEYGTYGSDNEKKTLYLPAGNYLVKASKGFPAGLELRGAGIGKTTITIASDYSGTNPAFVMNGVSDITISDLTITGNSKLIDAVFRFNSYTGAGNIQSRRVKIENVRFYNLWVSDAIMFGNASGAVDTHTYGEITIKNCYFENIYNPATPVAYADATPRCNAINLNETTGKAIITNNFIKNCSGDGIYAYGLNPVKPVDFNGGNWIISGNQIESCFMGIEINGNKLGRGLKIENNICKYSTRNTGYEMSIDGDQAMITNNTFYSVDRGMIEYTGIGGMISGNTGSIYAKTSGTGGVGATALYGSISCIEAYGFANIISNNNFTINRTGASGTTPTEFNGIHILGTTTDPAYQPTSFYGLTDTSGYWEIRGNSITGFTNHAVYAEANLIRKVNVSGNTFRSSNSSTNDDNNVVQIYGYDWNVTGNIFDMKNATIRNGGNGAVAVKYEQSDNTKSVVSGNTVINSTWRILNTTQLLAWRNDFVSTASPAVAFTLYGFPPVTSAQRTALTGTEGMLVEQTDGTKGVYRYTNGAWALQ